MLHLIFMWLIKSLFTGMAFIFEDVVEKLQLSSEGFADLVPGMAGFAPAKILSSVVMTIAIIIVFISIYKSVVSALVSPLSGNVKENPAMSIMRCVLAVTLIMLAPMIMNYAWYVLRMIMTWTKNYIQLTGFGVAVEGDVTFSDWINMYGNNAWFENIGSEVVSFIFAGILFYEVCMASLIYIERYLVFGIMLAIYPVGVAFTADKDNSSAFWEWLKIIAGQGAAIVISYAMFRMFEAQIAYMVSSAYTTDVPPYSKTLMYCVMIALLSLVKNSEKILRTFNINTFPTGDTARMLGGGIGRTVGMAMIASRAVSGAMSGRQGLTNAGRLDAPGSMSHSMRMSSAGGVAGTNKIPGVSGPGVGNLSNREIGRSLGAATFNQQAANGQKHIPSNVSGLSSRQELLAARKEAGISSYWDAMRQGGVAGLARNYQAKSGFNQGYKEAKMATEASSRAAYSAMFSTGKDSHGNPYDTGTSISGMSSSNMISATTANDAFKLNERMGDRMGITEGTNAVAGGFRESINPDIGYLNIADKSVPEGATMQASGYFVSADIENASGAVAQQTLFISGDSFKAGEIIDGGIVGKQKYDLGDGLWGYIMTSPEELSSDWAQVQEAIHGEPSVDGGSAHE